MVLRFVAQILCIIYNNKVSMMNKLTQTITYLYMFHIRAMTNIYTYVTNQQTHTDEICFSNQNMSVNCNIWQNVFYQRAFVGLLRSINITYLSVFHIKRVNASEALGNKLDISHSRIQSQLGKCKQHKLELTWIAYVAVQDTTSLHGIIILYAWYIFWNNCHLKACGQTTKIGCTNMIHKIMVT